MQLKTAFKKVVIIAGPTAVGKTDLAIRLAERLGDAEIISADSRLLYRGMDIGTAKPSREEQARIPHHMIDLADPDENWSLAVFQNRMMQTIDEIKSRKKLPIIAGGTGQYIRSLIEGWSIPAVKPLPHLREVLERWGNEIGAAQLYQKLALIDPLAAARIDANNLRRSIRALEVIFTTGNLFSTQKEKVPPNLDFKVIGLMRQREELYARVDNRIEAMFEQGFMTEVKQLLDKGYSADLPTLSAIGYREVVQHIHGDCSLEEAKVQMRRKTREFIRRQANWFKPDDPMIEWHCMNPDPLDKILVTIHSWLEK